MARGIVMTDEELSIRREALIANVREAFLVSDVCYYPANRLKCLARYKVNTTESKKVAAEQARKLLNASIVSVGGNKVAFVKRKDNQ